MNEEMKAIIKDEAVKYAMHYGNIFLNRAKFEELSVKEHYEDLKFERTFFNGIIFEPNEIYRYLSDGREAIIKKNDQAEVGMRKAEEFEEQVVKDVSELYKEYFLDYYLTIIEDMFVDLEEDMQWAKEDEEYHEKRKYINEEAFIGGPVSEEERTKCIENSRKEQGKIKTKMSNLNKVKEEIEQMIGKKLTNS